MQVSLRTNKLQSTQRAQRKSKQMFAFSVDSQSGYYKACPLLGQNGRYATPHPPAPSPTRGEGERRDWRKGESTARIASLIQYELG